MSAKIAKVWNGSEWVNVSSPVIAGNSVVAYQPTAPLNPITGQLWVNDSTKVVSVWSGSAWIPTSISASDITTGTLAVARGGTGTTTSTGSGSVVLSVSPSTTGTLTAHHINPATTNTYDLGTSLLRWRNIYTQDLHLSNGIGDYTVVEGEEDLYITNNKTGKSYKFALIEVDPSEVPPKSES